MDELLARLRREREHADVERDKLAEFVRSHFGQAAIDELLGRDVAADTGRIVRATILFFDLRNSTGIAEQIPPGTFSSFLNELFTDIMDLIYGNGGSVNRLIGDGILATFGCPESTGRDARNAALTALQIRDYLSTYNEVRPSFLLDPVAAGLGLATGPVFMGLIGSVRRREYSIVGDAVNLAARLESLTKRGPFGILIDGETKTAAGPDFITRRVRVSQIRGKKAVTEVFTLDGVEGPLYYSSSRPPM